MWVSSGVRKNGLLTVSSGVSIPVISNHTALLALIPITNLTLSIVIDAIVQNLSRSQQAVLLWILFADANHQTKIELQSLIKMHLDAGADTAYKIFTAKLPLIISISGLEGRSLEETRNIFKKCRRS